MAIEAAMDEPPEHRGETPAKPRPHMTERARAAKEARDRRQAEALRENLRRRKAQARAVAQADGDDQK